MIDRLCEQIRGANVVIQEYRQPMDLVPLVKQDLQRLIDVHAGSATKHAADWQQEQHAYKKVCRALLSSYIAFAPNHTALDLV